MAGQRATPCRPWTAASTECSRPDGRHDISKPVSLASRPGPTLRSPCQSKCSVYCKAPRAPSSLKMSGFGIQLRPPVVNVDDMDSFWFYVLPNYVPCTRTSVKAAREEAPDPIRLAVLHSYDAVMHELRKLVSVASFNLNEPNAALHREPRCCETHRIRNAEDKRRIKHRFYASKLLKVKRGWITSSATRKAFTPKTAMGYACAGTAFCSATVRAS